MVAKIMSVGVAGIIGVGVAVEVDVASRGFPQVKIVGMPVRNGIEMRERLRTAFRNTDLPFPRRRIVINVQTPHAGIKDLAIDAAVAVGLLVAQGHISEEAVRSTMFVGKISLTGGFSPVVGSLPIIQYASDQAVERIFLPGDVDVSSLQQAKPVCHVYRAVSLRGLVDVLTGLKEPQKHNRVAAESPRTSADQDVVDLCHIEGQEHAKRALEVAAVGRHSVLLTGHPGVGKSLLAHAYKTILPQPTASEEYELRWISSVLTPETGYQGRAFVHVNQSVTALQLFGNKVKGSSGLVTQAHCGVLCMDELPDFKPACLRQLKELLDDRMKAHSRGHSFHEFLPKTFFIAARNPCPCGYLGHSTKRCVCVRNTITHHENRISGVLRDRLDISINVGDVYMASSSKKGGGESSELVRKRVEKAWRFQQERIGRYGFTHNTDIPHSLLEALCKLDSEAEHILRNAARTIGLSLRGYDKVRRVARSIADLDAQEEIQAAHVAEALTYR